MFINILFLFFLSLLSFGLGNKILKLFKISLDNSLERFVFSLGLGLGTISYLIFLLAVLGLLYKWICLLLLLLILVISLWGIWKNKEIFHHLKHKISRDFKFEKAYIFEYSLLVILFFYILLCFFSALAPPVDWDSLVYHLPIPKIWIQNHKAIYIPYIEHSARHLAVQTIYALAMVILQNDTIPGMIIWMSSLWLILCVYAFCSRYLSPRVGILAMSALYCTPFISAITCKPLVDVPYICFGFLAFYAFFKYVQSNDYKMLILSSVMGGFSAACKQFGIISFIGLFLLLIIIEIKRKSFIKNFKRIVLFGLIFTMIIAPWIIKCYINTGELFNSSHGGALLLVGQREKTKLETDSTNTLWYILRHIYNIPSFVLIDNIFYRSMSGTLWSPGIFLLAFLPCLILLKKVDRIVKYSLIYPFVVILIYAIIPEKERNLRYISCILPCLFISGAYTVYRLLNDYESIKKYIKILVVLSAFFNIIPVAKWTYAGLPIIFKMEDKTEYLDRRTRIGSAFKYVNENLSDDDKIFSAEQRTFYYDKPYITIQTIKDLIYTDPDTKEVFGDIPKIIQRLKSEKVTHLLANENYSNTGFGYLPKELAQFLIPIYSSNRVYVYKFNFLDNDLNNK